MWEKSQIDDMESLRREDKNMIGFPTDFSYDSNSPLAIHWKRTSTEP